MGNICRSPTGEAVLKAKALRRNMDLIIDSAGTTAYHQGSPPDKRAREVGEEKGYDFSKLYSRQIEKEDFERFDMILAADRANIAYLFDMAPEEHHAKISLFLSHLADPKIDEIPDPYFGDDEGFEWVLNLIEKGCDPILDKFDLHVALTKKGSHQE